MLTFLKVLWKNVLDGPATEPFPFGETHTPKRLRGKAHIDASKCTGCGTCKSVCAGGAIRLQAREDGTGINFYLWHNSCSFCGYCEMFCPTGAITLSTDWSTAHLNSEKYDYKETEFIPYQHCVECDAPMPRLPESLISDLYGEPNEEIRTLYTLCPECRRKKAAMQMGV
ncbi:4Fe-4S binding protein [Desulfobaculum bizertense]|uniref:Formate hydrogenlyase subunit 6/NADH:ubiquinone oxidoreductase subunit (Chain I) n=1 Tax=Desulfobaculum bizertense DSM 18034 TaxID=1121442 RepID=A0A1T4VSY8_9BACT|nr:4Fe-4S dicluster domain-containing protein [Desulfobaculum bizertense]UIJ38432.1 4Fe-4S dicluster domain-containing protein [Desulfobaculum bizertense]SKA68112.1 Formate hydrogenlyase subunit 6/NADH:ubiquinone oxidoreductase subunit (chain I) [Desulfobaculum bizertense DSM 18034]